MNSKLLCSAISGALLSVALVASADDVHMKVTQGGSPVGENSYSESADGAFRSSTTLEIGSIKISSTLTGHYSGGKILDYQGESVAPNGKSTIQLKDGKIHVEVAGKSKDGPYENPSGAYGGNLLPQFSTSAVLVAEKQILADPATKETVVNA